MKDDYLEEENESELDEERRRTPCEKEEKRRRIKRILKEKLKTANINDLELERDAEGFKTSFSHIYRFKGIIGMGAFGLVVAVTNKATNENNALKVGSCSKAGRLSARIP